MWQCWSQKWHQTQSTQWIVWCAWALKPSTAGRNDSVWCLHGAPHAHTPRISINKFLLTTRWRHGKSTNCSYYLWIYFVFRRNVRAAHFEHFFIVLVKKEKNHWITLWTWYGRAACVFRLINQKLQLQFSNNLIFFWAATARYTPHHSHFLLRSQQ